MSTARVASRPVPAPSVEEKIRFRAYELFQKRGGQHGRDLDDWLQAETDILQQKLGPTPVRATPAKRGRAKRNGN